MADNFRIGVLIGMGERAMILVDQSEVDRARQPADLQIVIDLIGRTATEIGNVERVVARFCGDPVRDNLLRHAQARADAGAGFDADAMQKLFIGRVADALPLIDIVHDLIVAGIAERLLVAALHHRARHEIRRQYALGITLVAGKQCRVRPDRRKHVIAAVPELLPLRDHAVLAGDERLEKQLLTLGTRSLQTGFIGFEEVLVGAEEIDDLGTKLKEVRQQTFRAAEIRIGERLAQNKIVVFADDRGNVEITGGEFEADKRPGPMRLNAPHSPRTAEKGRFANAELEGDFGADAAIPAVGIGTLNREASHAEVFQRGWLIVDENRWNGLPE
jgi:hypothetical protein